MLKRPLLLLVILFDFLCAFGQARDSATIKLDIHNSIAQQLKVSMFKDGDRLLLDTITLAGKPEENISIRVPVYNGEQSIIIRFSRYGPGGIFPLMPGEQLVISTDLSDPHKIEQNTQYKGAKHTQEYHDFREIMRKLYKEYTDAKDNYMDAVMGGKPDTTILKRVKDSTKTLYNNHEINWGLETSSLFLIQYILAGTTQDNYNFSTAEYQALKEKFSYDPFTLKVINDYEQITVPGTGISYEVNAVKRGSYLADFTLPNRKGKQISLSGFKGKYVLVDV